MSYYFSTNGNHATAIHQTPQKVLKTSKAGENQIDFCSDWYIW